MTACCRPTRQRRESLMCTAAATRFPPKAPRIARGEEAIGNQQLATSWKTVSDSDTPPPPYRFFRIIRLQAFSRHRIDLQWLTGIFFFCNDLPARIFPSSEL